MGVEEANWQSDLLRHDSDRFRQVGIVRHDDSNLKALSIGVPQQVRSEVYIRSLLFGLIYPNFLRRSTFVRYMGME